VQAVQTAAQTIVQTAVQAVVQTTTETISQTAEQQASSHLPWKVRLLLWQDPKEGEDGDVLMAVDKELEVSSMPTGFFMIDFWCLKSFSELWQVKGHQESCRYKKTEGLVCGGMWAYKALHHVGPGRWWPWCTDSGWEQCRSSNSGTLLLSQTTFLLYNLLFLFHTWLWAAFSIAYITYLWTILAFSRDFHEIP